MSGGGLARSGQHAPSERDRKPRRNENARRRKGGEMKHVADGKESGEEKEAIEGRR